MVDKLSRDLDLQIEINPVKELKDLQGTLKFKKSTRELMKEIDEGWD